MVSERQPTLLPLILIRTGGLPLQAWSALCCQLPDWRALQAAEAEAAARVSQAFDIALHSLPESALRRAVYNARKDFFQRQKLPAAAIVQAIQAEKTLAPLAESLARWQQMLLEKQTSEANFEQALAANYRQLQHFSGDETLRRALLFASHELLRALPGFAEKPLEQFDKKDRRTALSLVQYLARGVFKTSPLGRFTTVEMQRLAAPASTEIPLGQWQGEKTAVTPNVALLEPIYAVLLREPAFFHSLKISLNPCFAAQDRPALLLHFDGEQEAFQALSPDPVIKFVVALLLENNRAMPFPSVLSALAEAVEASPEALEKLLFRLIDIGLLEWQLPERGLSPAWCGALYNYLGHLPASPVLTEAAYLLQWLRTAARTLPFQRLAEAQEMQRSAVAELKNFLEKHGEMPPVPPEQVFFEDVTQQMAPALPPETFQHLGEQLAECWRERGGKNGSPLQLRLFVFAQKFLATRGTCDFLEFSRQFLETPASAPNPVSQALAPPITKLGALLQIFEENGRTKAVVNALYPGGGKMFVRWLHLFPSEMTEGLRAWVQTESPDALTAAFPWQSWSNANFQPSLLRISVAIPGARVGHSAGGRSILLADLGVRLAAAGYPELFEKQSGLALRFSDLGLEAPQTRPPVMQVLWHLGVPRASSEDLLAEAVWETNGEIRHRRRLEYKSLVLARAMWILPEKVAQSLFAEGASQAERVGRAVAKMSGLSLPSRFFVRLRGLREKPQFFDTASPVSMLLLEKTLRGAAGEISFTEMLPCPEQWLGEQASEWTMELV